MTDIKRETLGKHSFLQMDLHSFRMDPVVGLSYITEIQSTFGIKCICHLCGTMFSHIGGQNHVTSLQHYMRYLREKSPESYEYACQFPTRSARSRAMHRILQDIERSDGRGTTVFYVFEDKPSSEENSSSSPDEPDAVKFRQAFEESVNQELQIARQKIEDDDLFLDEEVEEDDPFSDRSAYVQLFDLEGERDSLFEENVTENADITCEDAGASYDSPKLRATDVSDPNSEVPALSSVSKGNKNEKEGEQKNDDQEGSDGDKMPKQAVDDKTKNEEKDKVELHSRVVFQWHELGKISFLKRTLQEVSTEPFIGLSYVTEYQHITDIQCICRLCGVTFGYYSGKTHLLGFKHRLRYLRQRWPLAYAEFTKLKTKREVNPKLHPIVKTIEKKDGPGTPQIRVYGCKDGSKKEGNNSNSVSDNQNQDSCDGTDMSQAEIDKQHSEFMSFVHQEHQHEKVFVREPVVFEHGYKLENPPIDPRLNMPPHHDPMGVDPYLRQHPYHMRMRPDPYFNPNPFERPMRARPYPDKGPIPDPFIKMGRDEPYFDPDPTKRMRRDDPDPLIRERQHDADLLERRRGDVPYLDPDPLKRIRRGEPYYDPDPLKRRGHRESYLDPNPLKRLRFNEPYIDPDPLKRVLPSQKAAKKPVVIDYGHGSEKKSAKNTADQWEQDIKDILNDSKAPDSLAQLSCSYSSPKKEDTPPPSQPKRELPFSRSYIERSKVLQEKSSSSKKERSQYSPDREESRGYKLGSSSRKYRRSRSPLSIKERSRAMRKDPVKRDRTDSSS